MVFYVDKKEEKEQGEFNSKHIHSLNLCWETELFSHTSVFIAKSVMRQSLKCKSGRSMKNCFLTIFLVSRGESTISHSMMDVFWEFRGLGTF